MSSPIMRRMQLRAAELVREFYEAMVMLTVCLLMQWNQCHVVRLLSAKKELSSVLSAEEPALSWSAIFFAGGLLITLTQRRPQWIKRCGPVVRPMLLLLEMFAILFVVDYVLLAIWQPCFNIADQALYALAHAQWAWTRFIFHYFPGLSTWMINDAFAFMRFAVSLSWFLLAIESSAPKWRLAIDFLILGQLPEVTALPRRKRRNQRQQQQQEQQQEQEQTQIQSSTETIQN